VTDKPGFKTRLVDTIGAFDLHETTDSQGSLFVTPAGAKNVLASAWGPAADGTGEWFVSRWPSDAVRIADRQAAIEYITRPAEAVTS
jgi:hypothetical protein